MRAVLLRSLLVIGIGAGVLAVVLFLASTVDGRPPQVLEIGLTQAVPDDADTALITTSIEISFSEPVDPAGAAEAIALDPPMDGSLTSSGSTLIFTPAEPLALETAYALTIGPGIRDLAGNAMTDVPDPYEFVTTGRPVLAESDPPDGAEDVPVDAAIALVFSGLMDTASVEAALEIEPSFDHELRWSGERLEIVPSEALEPGSGYTIRVGESATDVAGVALDGPISIGFRTVDAGLGVGRLVPADGSGGISPRTQIAVAFDRSVDPESVSADLLSVTPDVPGTLELVGTAEDPDSTRLLVFTPSAPLPPNTTFEVALDAGISARSGGSLAEPVAWSFTTGAPQATLSNQVLFVTDRSGVANLWAMNPDGTGQHQVSAELAPVLEYAAAPDGSSLVVGDGRRLVYLRADGSERRELTDPTRLEFDVTYAPGGSRIVFARADAETGALLGLWEWEVEGGAARELDLPQPLASGARATASPESDGDDPPPLRAPSFSPDGGALAFVDLSGAVGILELRVERLTVVDLEAAGMPAWDPGSGNLLVPVGDDAPGTSVEPPVAPLAPDGARLVRIARSGAGPDDAGVPGRIRDLVTDASGRLGWVDGEGRAHIADELGGPGSVPRALDDAEVSELAFGPIEDVVLVVLGGQGGGDGRLERVDLASGERTRLASDGREVRWLP